MNKNSKSSFDQKTQKTKKNSENPKTQKTEINHKDARKLNDNNYRKRIHAHQNMHTPIRHRTMKSISVKKIRPSFNRFGAKNSITTIQKRAPLNTKRQLVARSHKFKPPMKRIIVGNRKNSSVRSLNTRIPVKRVYYTRPVKKQAMVSHNHFTQHNKRILNQNKFIRHSKFQPSMIKRVKPVPVKRVIKKIVNKSVVARRQLAHKPNLINTRNRIQHAHNHHQSVLLTQKHQKWNRHNRKLSKKQVKNDKSKKRNLNESVDHEAAYPRKLMNASISYPIMGVVNLGGGEYDLHVS